MTSTDERYRATACQSLDGTQLGTLKCIGERCVAPGCRYKRREHFDRFNLDRHRKELFDNPKRVYLHTHRRGGNDTHDYYSDEQKFINYRDYHIIADALIENKKQNAELQKQNGAAARRNAELQKQNAELQKDVTETVSYEKIQRLYQQELHFQKIKLASTRTTHASAYIKTELLNFWREGIISIEELKEQLTQLPQAETLPDCTQGDAPTGQ